MRRVRLPGLDAAAANGKVNLSWTAPASDGGVPVTSYRVYDSTTSGFALGAPVQSPAGTSTTVVRIAAFGWRVCLTPDG